jgi:hypothetical protein
MFQLRVGKMFASFALGLGMIAASAVPAMANDHYRDSRDYREQQKCEQRIRKAEEKLQREIYKHGRHSRQAEHRRQELREAQQQCRYYGWR